MAVDWTVKDVPAQPVEPERVYTATIEGLEVRIKETHPVGLEISTALTVFGYLDDIRVYAYPATNVLGYGVTVEEAKALAVAIARRLYAAGVRGTHEAQP